MKNIPKCEVLKRDKKQIVLTAKMETMEVFFLPRETLFLEFQLSNGSGWLTSHRLIICEHERGHLEGHTPVMFFLKNYEKTKLKGPTLIVQFKGKQKAKITLAEDSPNLIREVKDYIEKASLNYRAQMQI